MNVPLHLRLAYAGCFSDPYSDTRWRLLKTSSPGRPSFSGTQRESTWLRSLLRYIEQDDQWSPTTISTKDGRGSDDVPCVQHARRLQTQEKMKDEESSGPVPTRHRPSSPSPIRSPASPASLPRITAEETCASHEVASPRSAFERSHPTSNTTGRSEATTASSTSQRPPTAAEHLFASPQKSDVTVQTDAAEDTAAHPHDHPVPEQLVGMPEGLLADITTSLERRLQQCVLKTLALDDANQQLICAFGLPSVNAVDNDRTSHPPTSVAASLQPSPVADNKTAKNSALDAAEKYDKPAASSVATVAANRTESGLSDEAKKELAMHLYALRHQVVVMRQQLDAHEAAHARQVNAFRAASSSSAPHRPPVRVEVVKAFEEEPVSYRKGPWRAANFAAAAVHRNKDGKSGGVHHDRDDGSEARYTSDDFTGETSTATSTAVSTELENDDTLGHPPALARKAPLRNHGDRVAAGRKASTDVSSVDSDTSLSSTEGLFQRRQAAALQARAQRMAAATAKDAPKRFSSSTSSSPYSTSKISYSSLTESSTVSTSDTYTS